MYINGTFDGTGSGTLSTATGDRNVGTELSNLILGARTANNGDPTAHFKGLIDEFRIYNSTLSRAQINQNKAHQSRS
jgi:hypothetical protein